MKKGTSYTTIDGALLLKACRSCCERLLKEKTQEFEAAVQAELNKKRPWYSLTKKPLTREEAERNVFWSDPDFDMVWNWRFDDIKPLTRLAEVAAAAGKSVVLTAEDASLLRTDLLQIIEVEKLQRQLELPADRLFTS